MKKLVATVLSIISCTAAYALPLGNPSEASLLCDGLFIEGPCYEFCQPGVSWCEALSVRFGYYGDFVFNRHLEVDSHDIRGNIEDTKIYTNAAYLALNFFDRVDLFATLGGTNFWIDTNAFTFDCPNSFRFVLETDTDFSWSLGSRLTIWECGCTRFGFEAQYFSSHADIKRVTLRSSGSIYPSSSVFLKYNEWQFGFGISHRIWNLVPYIGVKISGVKADFGDAFLLIPLPPGFTPGPNPAEVTLRKLDNQHYAGYAFGVSLVDCEKMALTVEARYPDEKALYANGQIRF